MGTVLSAIKTTQCLQITYTTSQDNNSTEHLFHTAASDVTKHEYSVKIQDYGSIARPSFTGDTCCI